MSAQDSYASKATLSHSGKTYTYHSVPDLAKALGVDLDKLPFSLRVLLENVARHYDGTELGRRSIDAVAKWSPASKSDTEIGFVPARVILQDFTGVPCIVDLAAMRDAMAQLGGDPERINPLQPVDLVIDHSVVVDEFGHPGALEANMKIEYQRNTERYEFLRWGQGAFRNLRVVPPGAGIIHQVNLEYLGDVVHAGPEGNVYPDTVVGTDSHTPMINGLGVVGWGVGGIEAEAAMLGQPITMLVPDVVGVKLTGRLKREATATDLVLTVTEALRKLGVVGKFVEYYGDGLASLTVADRAVLANMSPEYGATIGFFPVDAGTIEFLRFTGRPEESIALVESYCREQGLFREPGSPEPCYSQTLVIDLSAVEPCIAGPRRPQDRVRLSDAPAGFRKAAVELARAARAKQAQKTGKAVEEKSDEAILAENATATIDGQQATLGHGAVVIASITSCTNTSNPALLVAAGLLARNAAKRGLKPRPWVKTSLAPGSRVVTDYLAESGLLPHLEQLGFHVVGYGCMTCIGNSGPLPEPVAEAVHKGGLVACAVLSGNRNFEGRVNPLARANYLASPALVLAYALAGSMNVNLASEPLGTDADGKPVMLSDIWPDPEEVNQLTAKHVQSDMYRRQYESVFKGDEAWRTLPVAEGKRFDWKPDSTYVRNPPFFEKISPVPAPLADIRGARVLAVLGDSVTTDHISPAGTIPADSPAGKYLIEHGVKPADFNSYGSRRGNHEVLMRGTFGNIRLRNQLAPGTEGGWTALQPDGTVMPIFDAAMRYKESGTPLVILAGLEYGSGSSRDWAAKGPALLGVKAAIAKTFERIHRSNLIGMGILPLEFDAGTDRETLGLTGRETYEILGIAEGLEPHKRLAVTAVAPDGTRTEFQATARLDTPIEVEYFKSGGILPYVLRQLMK